MASGTVEVSPAAEPLGYRAALIAPARRPAPTFWRRLAVLACIVALADTSQMGNRGQPGPVRVFGSLATVLLAGTHVANRIWVEGPISTLRRLQMALAGYVAVLGTTVVVAFRVPWNVLWRWSDRRYLCDDVTTNPQWLLTGGAAIVGSIVWFWIASFGQTRRANDELTAGGADVSSSSRRIPNRASQASAG